MKDESGNNVAVNDVNYDYDAWGCFKDNLSWKAANLQDEVKYIVTITGTKINGVVKDFEYWFKLTNEPPAPANPLAEAPTLLLPENDTKALELPIKFTWNKSENAEYYHLQASMTEDFAYITFEENNLTDTTFELTAGLNAGNQYYWKVIAYNIDNIPSENPNIWSFSTKEFIPEPPVAVYPLANNNDVARRSDYIWNSINEALYYNLEISTSSDFAESALVVNVTEIYDTTYSLAEEEMLEPLTSYFWRIKATLTSGSETEWSEAIPFKTNEKVSSIFEIGNVTINCYPNPFTNKLNISVNSKAINPEEESDLKIEIYNSLGIIVADLHNGKLEKFENSFIFTPNDLPQATYFCKITAGNKYKIIPINFSK
jgi:hypothetical protein